MEENSSKDYTLTLILALESTGIEYSSIGSLSGCILILDTPYLSGISIFEPRNMLIAL